jgi:hypothetical protein
MDPIKILKRAWTILWSYRALWIFGIILALTTAGGGGSSGSSGQVRNNPDPNGFNFPQNGQPLGQIEQFFQQTIQSFEQPPFNQANFWIGIAIAVLVIILILAVVSAFFRYISETALIRMVDQYEHTGEKATIRQGFRFGWSRTSWRLFLINLLVSLPNILAVLFILSTGAIVFALIYNGSPFGSIVGVISAIGALFLVIFVLIIYNALMNVLRHFFWRVCALEGAGVIQSIRLGFSLVKRNWKSAGLMWLIMIGLGLGWIIASVIAYILLIPVFLLLAVVGLVVAAIPAALVFGLTSLFLSAPLTWIIAAVIGLPILFLVIGLPVICLRGLKEVYRSTVWTLTYRELKALETVAPVPGEPSAPEILETVKPEPVDPPTPEA